MKWLDVSNKKNELEDEEQYHKEISSSDGLRKFMEVSIEGASDSPAEEEGLKLFFTISTPHVDRDGDIIDQTGWDLDEYKKNPVVLWAHDSSAPPVARANSTYLSPVANKSTGEDQIHLMSVAEFPSRDLYPFANMVGRLYKNGFLHGASVGFLPVEYEMSKEREGFAPVDFKRQKLLEWSAVPVPSNPEGLVQARSAGIDLAPMVEWAEKILDGEGALILPRHLIEEVRKNSSSKVFIMNKDSSIKIDMSALPGEGRVKSIEEAVTEAITEERERIAQMAKEEETTSPEEKDLTSDENQTKEKAPQGAAETNNDDLRRLAKATFEQKVLSLTHELKDLIGQISTGDDR